MYSSLALPGTRIDLLMFCFIICIELGEFPSLAMASMGLPKLLVSAGSIVKVPGGQPLALTCTVDGTPLPYKVAWTKNGQEVVSAGDWKVNPGNITTMHVTSQHAGVYVCTAWNDLGLNRSVQVVVTGLQFRKSLPGVSAARLGMPLSMACETINTDSNGMQTSNLSREMTWYRDGSPIANQTSGTQAPDTFNFSIEHVRVKDQGQYTCLVSSANTTISMATYLFVFAPVKIIQPHVDHVECVKGKPLVLNCTAEGYPPPIVSWYRNGQVLRQRTDWHTKESGRVAKKTHASISDHGTYSCTAENAREKQTQDIFVSITGRPGQLVVTAESLGGWPPKVMVAWRPSSDGQQSVTSYKVMAMVATDNWENATWPEPTVVQPDKHFVVLSHLKLGTKYVVRVWASNDLGAGKMAAVYFHTPWWSFKKGPNLEEIPTVEELLNDEVRTALSPRHAQIWILTIVGSVMFGTVFFILFAAYKNNCQKGVGTSPSLTQLVSAGAGDGRPGELAEASTANNSVSFLNPLFDASCIQSSNYDTVSLNNLELIWQTTPTVHGSPSSGDLSRL